MNDSFDRGSSTHLPSGHVSDPERDAQAHVIGSLFPPAAQKLVLVVYALLLLVAGSWLLFGPDAKVAPVTRAALRVGVIGGPEVEVLELVKTRHPELGIEVVRFDRAEHINPALSRGEIDAASFQDGVSFEAERQKSALPLAPAALTVTLPLGFYGKGLQELGEIAPGSKVLVSNDPHTAARALLVLYHYGLIDFSRYVSPAVRISDVTKNSRELVLQAASRADLLAALGTDAVVALTYEDATSQDLSPARHALALEDAYSPFASVLAVHMGTLSPRAAWLDGLLAAYRERDVKDFILKRFADSVRRPW